MAHIWARESPGNSGDIGAGREGGMGRRLRPYLGWIFFGGLALEASGIVFGLAADTLPLGLRLLPLILGYLLALGAYLAGWRGWRGRSARRATRYAALNRAPLRPSQDAAFVARWAEVLPRVLALPGCLTVTLLVDPRDRAAISVVLYDSAAHATSPPTDPAYWQALGDLDRILDLSRATRTVYEVSSQ